MDRQLGSTDKRTRLNIAGKIHDAIDKTRLKELRELVGLRSVMFQPNSFKFIHHRSQAKNRRRRRQ